MYMIERVLGSIPNFEFNLLLENNINRFVSIIIVILRLRNVI
jgi:hypothetical protein